MNSGKKTAAQYSQEDLYFSQNIYKEKIHDEIIAVNVYVFLIGSGCVESNTQLGSLNLEHKQPVIQNFQDQLREEQSFLKSSKLQSLVNLNPFMFRQDQIKSILDDPLKIRRTKEAKCGSTDSPQVEINEKFKLELSQAQHYLSEKTCASMSCSISELGVVLSDSDDE